MCSRHSEPGAGHPDSARPYRVTLKDQEGPSWTMTVTASSPDMARSIARSRAYEDGGDAVGVLKVEPSGFYDDPNAEGER